MKENDRQFRFSTTVLVRFGDMDAMGHVNNAKYLTYFEEARIYYFQHVFGKRIEDLGDESFILAEATVKFRSALRGGDRLEVFLRVSRIGTKSFDMQYKILHAENRTLIAEGSTVQVMYDYEKGTTIPIPDEMKTRIEKYEGLELSNPHIGSTPGTSFHETQR